MNSALAAYTAKALNTDPQLLLAGHKVQPDTTQRSTTQDAAA